MHHSKLTKVTIDHLRRHTNSGLMFYWILSIEYTLSFSVPDKVSVRRALTILDLFY